MKWLKQTKGMNMNETNGRNDMNETIEANATKENNWMIEIIQRNGLIEMTDLNELKKCVKCMKWMKRMKGMPGMR